MKIKNNLKKSARTFSSRASEGRFIVYYSMITFERIDRLDWRLEHFFSVKNFLTNGSDFIHKKRFLQK